MDYSRDTDMLCPACRGVLKRIFYQRRAADEPPDKVIYCTNCPVDISELSFSYTPLQLEPLSKPVTKRIVTNHIALTPETIRMGTCRTLRVEGSAALRCNDALGNADKDWQKYMQLPATLSINGKLQQFPLYYKSLLGTIGFCATTTRNVTPKMQLSSSTSILSDPNISTVSSELLSVAGEEILVDIGIENGVSVLRRSLDRKRYHILIVLYDDNSEGDVDARILDGINRVLTRYGTEVTMKSFADSEFISSLHMVGS